MSAIAIFIGFINTVNNMLHSGLRFHTRKPCTTTQNDNDSNNQTGDWFTYHKFIPEEE